MALPKPKVIPITNPASNSQESRESFAVVNAAVYTATAAYETFKINSMILTGINNMNSSLEKLLAFFIDKDQRSDIASESEGLAGARKKGKGLSVVDMEESAGVLAEAIAVLEAAFFGSAALIGATITTMLEKALKEFVKNINSTILAVVSFSRLLKIDVFNTLEYFSGIIKKIFSFDTYLKIARDVYMHIEWGIHRLNEFKDLKIVEKLSDLFHVAVGHIHNLIQPLTKFVAMVKNTKVWSAIEAATPYIKIGLGWIGSLFKFLGSFMVAMTKGIGTLMESGAVKFLTAIMPSIGKLFKKLLWPIQVIFSVIDFIDGFSKGYSEEGILEGIKEGLVSVFDGFFGGIVNMARDFFSWVLGKFGLEETAAEFEKTVNSIWEGVKNTFSSFLDIFKGIFTLDAHLIWKGVIGTGQGITDFIIDNIKGIFSLLNTMFKELTGVDISQKITDVMNWFTDEFIDLVKGLYDTIINGLMSAARTITEETVGNTIANKIFGPQAVTDQQIEERALENAQARVNSNKSWSEYLFGENHPEDIKITPQDYEDAKKQLKEEGFILDKPTNDQNPATKILPKDQDSIMKSKVIGSEEKKQTEQGMTFFQNNNISNGNNGGTKIAPVINFQTTERASMATPATRYGHYKR